MDDTLTIAEQHDDARLNTPEPEPDAEAIVRRRAEEEAELSAPKRRTGGPHRNVLPGEVGPCTRCGWVWTPSASTLRRRSQPQRCANCRSDYWHLAPSSDRARHPDDPEWTRRRDTIANRKKRRKLAKLRSLAHELNTELVNDPGDIVPPDPPPPATYHHDTPAPAPVPVPSAVDLTVRQPWQSSAPRARLHVIPPPPGLEDGK